MTKVRFTLKGLSLLVFMFALTSLAHAQATRTWVSGTGDDANPCSRTAPCKTFPGAYSKTAVGGEIDALDPGGFGTITIGHSVTIDGGGGEVASILAASGSPGVTFNGGASDTVILRNLRLNGIRNYSQPGGNGINYNSGKALIVENCNIFGFVNGINVSLSNNGILKVTHSSIEDMSGDGIHMSTTVGQVTAMVDNTNIQDCAGDGIEAAGLARVGVTHSTLTHNGGTGILESGNDNGVTVDNTFIAYSTTGLKSCNAGVPSHIRVSDTVITMNGTGVDAVTLGGTIDSFQGNSLIANTNNGSFSSTTLKQ